MNKQLTPRESHIISLFELTTLSYINIILRLHLTVIWSVYRKSRSIPRDSCVSQLTTKETGLLPWGRSEDGNKDGLKIIELS